MTGWTVKGEAGKNIDATERPLSDLRCDGATLTTASLNDDEFVYTAAAENATGAGVIVPSNEQEISLWYNGTRRFLGHCTEPRIKNNQLIVTCSGPWWWLKNINLTSVQTDGTGATGTRPSFVFPTQSVALSIQQLIDRMITDGVPIRRGTIDACFAFPRMTFSEVAYAQALSDLLSIVPDAVAWFDYSDTTVNGYPILNITRRGNMASVTHTIGSDPIERHDLYPRLDSKVESVTVTSVKRNATSGKVQWMQALYGPTGAGSSGSVGKRQIVVANGPEVDTFLPRDQFDSFQIQAPASIPDSFITATDQGIATAIRDLGISFTVCGAGPDQVSMFITGSTVGAFTVQVSAPKIVSKDPLTGMYAVTSADSVPDWMTTENGYVVTDGTLNGWARYQSAPLSQPPANWSDIQSRATTSVSGYPVGTTSIIQNYSYFAWFQFSIPVKLINSSWPALTTIYRKQDHDYVDPPSDLAQNLLTAQNWVPWEGSIIRVYDEVDGTPMLNLKHNVANALPDCATMGALAKTVEYDLMRKRRTITFGPPARIDFGSLASKFRRSTQDNVVMMSKGVPVNPVGITLTAL